IGGLCGRALRFGLLGTSLEVLLLRHALGLRNPALRRELPAAGVMMLPIPRSGLFDGIEGGKEARAVPGITGLEVTVPPGSRILPLPEGDRYLGFLFARAGTPEEVEAALRDGHARLDIRIR
ncbi:MAG: ATP-grasp domain-containing protein, partial [Acidimicrobiia bacterium]